MIESAKISWKIGYRKRNSNDPIKMIKNPWWGWCADPFLFEYKEETYVFAEIWNYFSLKGCIGYYKIKGQNCDKRWHIIIEEKYHMSFPYIWQDVDGIHICAETNGAKKLGIYNCINFPKEWVYEKDF